MIKWTKLGQQKWPKACNPKFAQNSQKQPIRRTAIIWNSWKHGWKDSQVDGITFLLPYPGKNLTMNNGTMDQM